MPIFLGVSPNLIFYLPLSSIVNTALNSYASLFVFCLFFRLLTVWLTSPQDEISNTTDLAQLENTNLKENVNLKETCRSWKV